jgi:hypothetical protein
VNINSILGSGSFVTIKLREIFKGRIEIEVWKTIGYKNGSIECSNSYSITLKIGSGMTKHFGVIDLMTSFVFIIK